MNLRNLIPFFSNTFRGFFSVPLSSMREFGRLVNESYVDSCDTITEVLTQPANGTEYNTACRQRLKFVFVMTFTVIGVSSAIVTTGVFFYIYHVISLTTDDGDDNSKGPNIMKRTLDDPSRHFLAANVAVFAVVTVLSFVLRLINSLWVLKKLYPEDYLMVLVMGFYVAYMALINVAPRYKTNLYPLEMEADILANPADFANRVIGSKIVVAIQQCLLIVLCGTKFCVLGFLVRLQHSIPRYKYVFCVPFAYIWIGLAILLIQYYFVLCLPFSRSWALPISLKDSECSTHRMYSLSEAVLNFSSYVCLIISTIPIVWHSELPGKRKLVLSSIFGLALFTIFAAAMSKYYAFKFPYNTTPQLWDLRQASIAILIANSICIWPLLQKLFSLRTFSNDRFDIPTPARASNDRDGTATANHGLRHKFNRFRHRVHQSVSGIPGLGNSGNMAPAESRWDENGELRTNNVVLEDRMSRPWEASRRDTGFSVNDEIRPAITYRSLNNIA